MAPRPPKRQKISDDIGEDLICPITLALPLEPVTAMDGKVYERAAIEKHFQDKAVVKSPVTNEKMGKTLLAAHHITSIIEKSIANGSIKGEKGDVWQERKQAKEKTEKWRKAAEAGDGDAASHLGTAYFHGEDGLPENDVEAEKWFKVAADAGNAIGLCQHGVTILKKYVFSNSDQLHALLMIAEAAGAGSSYACLLLGELYAGTEPFAGNKGVDDFPENNTHAMRLLEKGIDNEDDDHAIVASDDYVEHCKGLLSYIQP